MALRVSASQIEYCRVDPARGCSLLTSRQVQYVVADFGLKKAKTTFAFMFWLYNFIMLACEDNKTLLSPDNNVVKLHTAVKQMNLRALTSRASRRPRAKVDNNAGNGRREGPISEGGPVDGDVEGDILSDVANLEALKGAGYTIPDEVEGFKSLLPVRVSFP